MGLNISPSIWQSYINAIYTVFKAKSAVKQLWMTFYSSPSKESHMNKLEDILSAPLKNGYKDIT